MSSLENVVVVFVIEPRIGALEQVQTHMFAPIEGLRDLGAQHIRLLCVVAAPEGIAYLQQAHAEAEVYTAALDRGLNSHKYILPGLGDAGDRLYGTK